MIHGKKKILMGDGENLPPIGPMEVIKEPPVISGSEMVNFLFVWTMASRDLL